MPDKHVHWLNFLRHPVERWIATLFVLLATLYSVTTPIFEAPDELFHFPVIQHIADGLGLPVQTPGVKTAWEQEGSQPPLYYILMSPIAKLIDTSDMTERLRYNPHAQPGDPYLHANRNLIVHSDAEAFPWRGTVLAMHLIRLVSIAFGACTVILTGVLLREVIPTQREWRIGTMALVAFNPMFLFISASVNNDNLVIVLSTLALLLIVQCLNELRDKAYQHKWLQRRVTLAIVIGLAALSKVSGLVLLLPAALALSVVHLSKREFGRWVASGLMLAAGVVLIAGWWYLRNLNLYGEVLGIQTMAEIAGRRDVTLIDLLAEFEGFRITYWALFGAVNILTFLPAYVMFDAFSVLALVGLLVYVWHVRSLNKLWPWSIFAAYAFALFVGVVNWTSITPASQGRLLFPGIAAIAALMWLGWSSLCERLELEFALAVRVGNVKWLAPIAMGVLALQAPFADILPAYAAPKYTDRTQLPQDMHSIEATFDDRMRLVGYVSVRRVDVDERLAFTLYWECLASMGENYSVFVSVKGRAVQEVGKLDAYPQRGLLATSDCPPGAIFADDYRLPFDALTQRPALLRAEIGLNDWPAQRRAAIRDGAGNPIDHVFIDVAGLPALAAPPAPAMQTNFEFGGMIRLDGYTLTKHATVVDLDLQWSVLAQPPIDYTVFVHVLDDAGDLLQPWDAPPLQGEYPTSYWQRGEIILDRRTLELPHGAARLVLGWYQPPAGPRLAAIDSNGASLLDDRIIITLD